MSKPHQRERVPAVYRGLTGTWCQPPNERNGDDEEITEDFEEYTSMFGIRRKPGNDGQRIPLGSHQDPFHKYNFWVMPDENEEFLKKLAKLDWSDRKTSKARTLSLCDIFSKRSIHAFDQDIRFRGSWTPESDDGEIDNLVTPLINSVRVFTQKRPIRFVILVRDCEVIKETQKKRKRPTNEDELTDEEEKEEDSTSYDDALKKFGVHVYVPDVILDPRTRRKLNNVLTWFRQFSNFSAYGNMTFCQATEKNNFNALFDVNIRSLRMICSKKSDTKPGFYRYWGTKVLERGDNISDNTNLKTKFDTALQFGSLSRDERRARASARFDLLKLTSLSMRREGDITVAREVKKRHLARYTAVTDFPMPDDLGDEKDSPKEVDIKVKEEPEVHRVLMTVLRQVLNNPKVNMRSVPVTLSRVGKGCSMWYRIRFCGPGFCPFKTQRHLARGYVDYKPSLYGGGFSDETCSEHLDRIWGCSWLDGKKYGSGRFMLQHSKSQTEIQVHRGHIGFRCFGGKCQMGKIHYTGFNNERVQDILFKGKYEPKDITTKFTNESKNEPSALALAKRVLEQHARETSGCESLRELLSSRSYNV